MKSPLKNINDRINKRPIFVGQKFSGKSMTIPGQDMTPLEILNRFRTGANPTQVYLDEHIHRFTTMNELEKLEYMKHLKESELLSRQDLKRQVDEFRQRMEQKPPTPPIPPIEPPKE